MLRRLHSPPLRPGSLELDRDEAHHARDVLRLVQDDQVELFDDAGKVARGVIERCDPQALVVRVEHIALAAPSSGITIASAVPKGERADWMIEKLSELGVDRFIPLTTARSVVHPAGKNKFDRWRRLATESAKQSRRPGVMRIEPLTALASLVSPTPGKGSQPRYIAVGNPAPGEGRGEGSSIFLDTDPSAETLIDDLESRVSEPAQPITLLIGPEGGWTPDETALLRGGGLTPVRLTATILRVETAALAAAAIVATWRARGGHRIA